MAIEPPAGSRGDGVVPDPSRGVASVHFIATPSGGWSSGRPQPAADRNQRLTATSG